MTHLNSLFLPSPLTHIEAATLPISRCQATVVVVSSKPDVGFLLDNICDFFDFGVEHIRPGDDLQTVLRIHRPMAVVADLDGEGQDGCHVMMLVAEHDPGLPILLLTGYEPALIGAADAVEELWQLSAVTQTPEMLDIGPLVEFLFHAGRRGNCIRMMPS